MANLNDIKAQIISLNPTNEEWVKWVNSQKRVENLINENDGLKDESTLKTMFKKWQNKKSSSTIKSTINNEEAKELLNRIQCIKDNALLEHVIKACQSQIEANVEEQRKVIINEAIKRLKEFKAIGGDIDELLHQL